MTTYTTLLDSPEYFDKVIELIEKKFHYKDNNSYASDFSPLMNSMNWKNLHLLTEGQDVVAHIGVRVVKTVHNIPLVFIGGVVVADKYEKEGHFTKLFKRVIDLYKDDSALFVLWSDMGELYKKFEFYQSGILFQTGDREFSEADAKDLDFKKLSLSDLDADKLSQIRKCYQSTIENQFIAINRGPIEWGVISTIESSDLYVHEKSGLIDFYFFINKGMDLKNVIHEFAGLTNSSISQNLVKLKPFKVWLPEKNYWIENNNKTSLFMGIFKIAEPKLFSELIYIWTDGEIEIQSIENSEITFHFQEQKYTQTTQEFLNLLMGPNRAEEFSAFKKELWIMGLDSI